MRLARAITIYIAIIAVTLVFIEVVLRVADFRDLRVLPGQYRALYDHDPELGWYLIPGMPTGFGDRINGMGLRDIELERGSKSTIAFVGDSFVYGHGVKAVERFTDLLRRDLPDVRIANVGVEAYGTDQEFLMLKRLWSKIEPRVVVLIVCVDNDHEDNSKNARHGRNFKPYLAKVGNEWRFQGIPVPRGHRWYYAHNWFAEHSLIVRLAFEGYMLIRHPGVLVPDPTNRLVAMMRDFVESKGAKFLVGLQKVDPDLEPFLMSQKIPYIRFDDAPSLPGDNHWNPEGHVIVAKRLKAFLAAQNAFNAGRP